LNVSVVPLQQLRGRCGRKNPVSKAETGLEGSLAETGLKESPVTGLERLLQVFQVIDQQPHAKAGAALGAVGQFFGGIGHAGDVQVRPGDFS
jgi:hypothetical protein